MTQTTMHILLRCLSEIQVAVEHSNRLFPKPSTFWWKHINFNHVNDFSISQGSVVTFFTCDGEVHNHLCLFLQDSTYLKLLKSVHL